MQPRKYIASILGASVIAMSTMAFAATTPPPPADDPPDTPAAERPALLWVYGDPTPQWLVFGYFGTEEACDKSLATMKPGQGQAAECFPVGVDPTRLHEKYATDTEVPPTTPPKK